MHMIWKCAPVWPPVITFFLACPLKVPQGGVPIPLVSVLMFSCCSSALIICSCCCTWMHSTFFIWQENEVVKSGPALLCLHPASRDVKNVFQFPLVFAQIQYFYSFIFVIIVPQCQTSCLLRTVHLKRLKLDPNKLKLYFMEM